MENLLGNCKVLYICNKLGGLSALESPETQSLVGITDTTQ